MRGRVRGGEAYKASEAPTRGERETLTLRCPLASLPRAPRLPRPSPIPAHSPVPRLPFSARPITSSTVQFLDALSPRLDTLSRPRCTRAMAARTFLPTLTTLHFAAHIPAQVSRSRTSSPSSTSLLPSVRPCHLLTSSCLSRLTPPITRPRPRGCPRTNRPLRTSMVHRSLPRQRTLH